MSKSTISTFELFQMFPDQESARLYLESRLWPNGKVRNISNLITRLVSEITLLKEVEKCVIRCSNCHRRRTAKQFNHFRHRMAVR